MLKKVWGVIVSISLMVAAFIAFLFWRVDSANKLIAMLQEQIRKQTEESEKLKRLDAEQRQEQKRTEERYLELIKELKEKHQLEILHISEDKEKQIKELIQKYKDDPDAQASHLMQMFGV